MADNVNWTKNKATAFVGTDAQSRSQANVEEYARVLDVTQRATSRGKQESPQVLQDLLRLWMAACWLTSREFVAALELRRTDLDAVQDAP